MRKSSSDRDSSLVRSWTCSNRRTADGDDGLVGERSQECDLLVVEGLHFDASKRDDADRLTLPQKGHAQNRTLALVARQLPAFREIVALRTVYVMDMLWSLVDQSPTSDPFAVDRPPL